MCCVWVGLSGRAQGTKHKAQNVGDGEKLTHPLDFYAANMIQYTAYVQFGVQEGQTPLNMSD